MTEQQFSMRLTMATTPELPRHDVRYGAAKYSVSRYRLTRVLQNVCMLLLVAFLSIIVYIAVSSYIVKSVHVVGVSMVPTLQEEGNYLLNMWELRNRDPHRNEIVVIRDPGDHGLSVKRIVAVGGESVHIKDGKVFVNGQELKEPYLLPHTHTFTYSQDKDQFITVGKDQYFVLGDNRLRSIDSRAYGSVSRQDVLGLVTPK